MEKNYILYLEDKTIKGTEVEILEAYSQYGGENTELLSLLARAKKVNGFIHFVIDDLELVCKPITFSCQNDTFDLIKVDNTYLDKITEDLPYIQKAINDLKVVLSSYQD